MDDNYFGFIYTYIQIYIRILGMELTKTLIKIDNIFSKYGLHTFTLRISNNNRAAATEPVEID